MINTTIPSNLRTRAYPINGHMFYENLWRFNSSAEVNAHLINGLRVSRKGKHFIINPNWNEQRLLEELTYSYHSKNRIVVTSEDKFIKHNGIDILIKETIYETKFSDGTAVEIIHRSKDVISGNLINDHISLLAISKPNP